MRWQLENNLSSDQIGCKAVKIITAIHEAIPVIDHSIVSFFFTNG